MTTPDPVGERSDAPTMTISLVARVAPLHLPGAPGRNYEGPLDSFAEDRARYVARNLAAFAEQRGGDTFVSVIVKRGDEQAGHEYRDGHFIREETS